ncbi:MAG: hypothetical protein P1R58_05260 [bacterium]|nr:hypothetical protein [bacterium]
MSRNYLLMFFLIGSLLLPGSVLAQEEADPPDSSAVSPEDSLFIDSLVDSAIADSTDGLTLEERYDQFKKKQKYISSVSFFDSVTVYYLSERQNLRSQIDRSFYHDAGDYFKSDPSFLLLKHQVTPMRETVSPFGLNMGRLNYLIDGQQFNPFEHGPEPDGLMDLNDVPTALDDAVYILPGAAGQLFGGQDAIASALTTPRQPEDNDAQTAFISDAGSFGYSYTRGRYTRYFKDGRRIDMSVGYRDAEGSDGIRRDDSYHYYAKTFFPLGQVTGLVLSGNLYKRTGARGVWQDFTGASVPRKRFDRSAKVGLEIGNSESTSRTEIGYKHLRQGSYTDGSYYTRFNITTNGGYLIHEIARESFVYQLELSGLYEEYDQGYDRHDRASGSIKLRRASLSDDGRFSQYLALDWVESYGALPSASINYFSETESDLFSLSVGYTERAPLQNELYKRKDTTYSFFSIPYSDRGNDSLEIERQLIGSMTAEFGSTANALRVGVTGGLIQNGIIWRNKTDFNGLGSTEYSPINSDISFVDFSSHQRLQLGSLFTLHAGGAYHLNQYSDTAAVPYSPDYDLFAGGELHLYWRQKIMHFYAYGEFQYTGLYTGYSGQPMGEEPILNCKLSFRIKKFRFNYHFQNVLSNTYMSREGMVFPGRYTFYNVTWIFFN